MKKIEEFKKDNLVGRLYENRVAKEKCFTFKVFKGEPVKENLIAMSYVYYIKQDKAREDLINSMDHLLFTLDELR